MSGRCGFNSYAAYDAMTICDILKTEPIQTKALERVLNRLLTSSGAREGLVRLAADRELLRRLSPELDDMVGFGGDGHKELWPHVLQVVEQAPPVLHLRWAALFHDVGKPSTFERHGKNKVTFYGHERVSAQMFDRFCQRHGILRDIRHQVRFLILRLEWVENYYPDWTDSAVRRFARNAGEHVDDLITLSQADMTTKHLDRKERMHARLEELRQRVRDIRALDGRTPPLPKGLGTALSQELGIPPSKQLGDVMKKLMNLVERGDLERGADVSVYVGVVQAEPAIFGL